MRSIFFSWFNLNDCVEKSFFKAVIIVALAACLAVVAFDLWVVGETATHAHLTALCLLILLIVLYSVNKVSFDKLTAFSLIALSALFTYRGHITDNFNHVTYVFLITIGFVNALVGKKPLAYYATVVIFCCLLSMLFKDIFVSPVGLLMRLSIPYLTIFFIVTVCSSYLKAKYERNQERLREMVALLNRKNARINAQNALLEKKFFELEELSRNQEEIITKKTATIVEKNRQLGDIAYANAHTIRGPLARMLGLLHLINADPKLKDFYFAKLQKEAKEMDEILIAVSREIEANIYK